MLTFRDTFHCFVQVAACSVLMAGDLYAKEANVDVSGRAHMNVDIERLKNGDSSFEAKFKIKTKRKHGVRLRTDIEINSDSETYFKRLEFNQKRDWGKILFGKLPKEMGIERLRGKKSRNAIDRSEIYRKLSEFNYTSDEPMLRGEWNVGESSTIATSLGFNSANDSFLLSDFVVDNDSFGVAYWLLLQINKTDETRENVWAQTFSLWGAGRHVGWHFELFLGVDPFETEVEKVIGTGRKVLYGAYMGEVFVQTDESQESTIRTFLQAGVVYHDVKSPSYNTHNGILGVKWIEDPMYYALQFELIGTNSLLDPDKRIYENSMINFEVGYYF